MSAFVSRSQKRGAKGASRRAPALSTRRPATRNVYRGRGGKRRRRARALRSLVTLASALTLAAVILFLWSSPAESELLGQQPLLTPGTQIATDLRSGATNSPTTQRPNPKPSQPQGVRVGDAYPVAVGQPDYPTPTGDFAIVNKERDPTWNPSSSAWARGLRPVGPGPANPLGSRWIGLSAPSIGTHGTNDPASVGTAVSHGCIRMRNPDVEELFERVNPGTRVRIILSGERQGRKQAAPDKTGPATDETRTAATLNGAGNAVGRSREGRPIHARSFGRGPSVLVIAGIHGHEPEGIRLADELSQALVAASPKLPRQVTVVARANPDGIARGTRQNGAGIDLNRNFPTQDFLPGEGRYYGGETAGSEPETQAILQLVDRLRPQLVVTIHAPLACVNYDGPYAKEAGRLARAIGLDLRPELNKATPGSLGTYFGDERSLPVLTLELAAGDNDWELYRQALLRLFMS